MIEEYDSRPEKPKSMVGVFVAVVALVAGVAAVLLIGPSETVNVARELIKTEKASSQDKVSEPMPDTQPEPAESDSGRSHPKPSVTIAKVEKHPPVAVPASDAKVEAPVRRRPVQIRPGMSRRELLDLYGAPDMKAASIVRGHMFENFTYVGASHVQQTVALQDGRVVDAPAN
jgi:hypothetical protein